MQGLHTIVQYLQLPIILLKKRFITDASEIVEGNYHIIYFVPLLYYYICNQ